METKSIAILLPGMSAAPSGGYKVVYGYANYLAARGHAVTVYHAPTMEGWRVQRTNLRQRLWLVRMNGPTASRRPSWFDLSPRVDSRVSMRLGSGALAHHDIVVATAAETAPLAALAAQRHRITGAYFIQHEERWAGSQVEETWKLPLQHIVISHWLAELSERQGKKPIHVPNAIDSSEFPVGPAVVKRSTHVAAMISDYPFKRADLLTSALERLAAKIPNFSARTFGTIPRPVSLPDFVIHTQTPSKRELQDIYMGSMVYLCTSDGEGWHLPPAEAMSCGCAVVSTHIPGVTTYADGVASFAPVGDLDSIVAATESLLRNPAELTRRSLAGIDRIHGYTPEDAGAAFEHALESSIAK